MAQATTPALRKVSLPAISGLVVSAAIVVGLAVAANRLTVVGNQAFGRQLLEYPLWAVGIALLAGLVLALAGLRGKVNQAVRTEFYLKTGLVLLGASINFNDILSIGARGMVQALVMVSSVFFFTWWLAGRFRLENKLRALIATSLSICGVSAAIAAAGAVVAKRSQLTYVVTLVILFALPLMVLQPYLAKAIGLTANVAGAWIGGNIDTTAAVVGAGQIHSDQALKVASIVKLSQNTLIGVAAFLLALYWVTTVDKGNSKERPRLVEIWHRFPKFVLGFLAVSIIATLGLLGKPEVAAINGLRTWFLTLAFVCIGLEFTWVELRSLGGKPIAVYAIATGFNTALALAVAWIIFGVFR
ncbi:MAG: putative sulfate exporter family transporter [Chloroflexi bacterium]|nr:putative sulfate exporter family transporter [Chloroflexota bacterium]